MCGISVDRTTIRCAIPTINDGGLDYNYCILNPPQLAFGDTRRFDEVRVAAMLGAGGAAVTYDDGSMDVWGGYSVLSYDFSWGTGVECVYPWN